MVTISMPILYPDKSHDAVLVNSDTDDAVSAGGASKASKGHYVRPIFLKNDGILLKSMHLNMNVL